MYIDYNKDDSLSPSLFQLQQGLRAGESGQETVLELDTPALHGVCVCVCINALGVK